MSTSNGVYSSKFVLSGGSATSVVSNEILPGSDAIDIAPSQRQVNLAIASVSGIIPNYIPAGGEYAQLLSKASATNYDLQFTDYWTDIAVPLASGQVNATDAPPPLINYIGGIQLPAFQGIPATAETQSLHLSLQFPHGWKSGSDVKPHLHYARGPTSVSNIYGQLAINVPPQPEYTGTYIYAASSVYYDSGSNQTISGASGGNNYAAFYEFSKNTTVIWSATGNRYVMALGNWTAAGPHGTFTARNLTGNSGTLTATPTYYVPTLGTFNSATVGPYTSTGGGGTAYTYAKAVVSSLTLPQITGTYNYVSDNISVTTSGGGLYTATAVGTAATYYCESTNMTIVYSSTDGCYVILNGNVAFQNVSGTLVVLMTGNTGTANPTRLGYSFPTIGTFNGITVNSYTSAILTRFLFEYSWSNVGDPPKTGSPASFPSTITHVITQTPSTTAYQHMIIPMGTISGTGKLLSSIIIARITRTPYHHADTFEDDLWALSFDVHALIRSTGYGPGEFDGA